MLRKKVILLLGIVVLSMFLFIRPMKAEIDVVELSPVADIFTEERGFGIQIRDYNYLQTYYWIGGDELRETYIKFNLPTIEELHSIKLKLTEVFDVNNNITDFPIRIVMVSNNWTEQDITWDSKLEEFGTPIIVYLTKDTSDEYYRDYIFDLSSFVDTIKGINDTLVSFYLSPNDLTVDFAYLQPKSSEYSNITCRPKLIVEYGVPEPPTPFTLTSNAGNPDRDGKFILQWTDSDRSDYYSIYQNDSLIESGITSHFYIMNISNGSFSFKVVAFNEFGNASSNEINLDVEIQDIPPSSFLLTSNANSPDVDGYFMLQWSDSDYTDEYSLYRNGTVVIYNGVNRNYYVENYSSGSYTFKVVSFNDYGNTSSNELTVTVEIPPEPKPYPDADFFYADLDQYYGTFVAYIADEYDFFNASVWSDNIITGYIMDESNYNQWVDEGIIQPSSNIDYVIFGIANRWHTFIPTHADTWYFVFINAFAEHTHLDAYIYFHEDYFTEPEPDPDPDPEPEPNDIIIPAIIGFAALGLVVVIGEIYRIKKVRSFTS